MIKKPLINELINRHDPKDIEQHLIYQYLTLRGIKFSENAILRAYFENFSSIPELYLDVSILEIDSIKELEKYLELIIPERDRKLNGAFFTPDFVIDFIIDHLEPQVNHQNLDPSCGCGAFLIGLTEYYRKTFNKPIKQIIKENIFGADILEYNVQRAKLMLTIYALQFGELTEDSDFNLWNHDSLKIPWTSRFDNIVGNPPYVKFQDLSESNRSFLSNNWTTVDGGTFNLYFAFFELGYTLLKTNGKLGYITPNNYFTSLAGEGLRRFFQTKKCVTRVIDFSHKKVFDAQTYTAITFISKNATDSIYFDRIDENQSPETFLSKVNGSPNYLRNLNSKKWRLLKTNEQENVSKIETIGQPIGKMFEICVGIATLKDDIFFVDGSTKKRGVYSKITANGVFEIESEIVRAVYRISDFKTQLELANNQRQIICPYKIKNGVAFPIPEELFKSAYPKCYAYLLSEKNNLSARDKGKVNFSPFYVWGRTQGLTRLGKRIVHPTFSQHPRFMLIDDEASFFTNGYGIFFKKQEDSELFDHSISPITKEKNSDVVQKILNSIVMDYYIRKTSVSIEGGYPCYQKNFIEKFTIPALTDKEITSIREIADPKEIDAYLIRKYDLNIHFPNLSE